VQKPELTEFLQKRVAQANEPVVILTVGAGDIDRLVPEITEKLKG
jgi:UDP-N-acetylmuramate-alanine ligase